MIGPTSAPIALALPPWMRSTTSGFSAMTLATIASSSPLSSIAVRPSRSAISAGSPPSATSLSRIVRPAAAVTVLARTSVTSLASEAGATDAPSRERSSVTQIAVAFGSGAPSAAASKYSPHSGSNANRCAVSSGRPNALS